MIHTRSSSRAWARVLSFGAAVALVAACGHVIAPSPPATAAELSRQEVVLGVPIAIAAKAARVMGDYGFSTKRFGSDSTWGWRALDSTAVRLRYTHPSNDSTRVLVELWGCRGQRGCLQGALALLLGGISAEDAPPQ